mmetsp:Transcript_40639/g.115052  ORF Transcript_40639/g.115052 Transcript_40639/m.115052 type:complete len:111 (-) Transcript_40639:651-983(-)
MSSAWEALSSFTRASVGEASQGSSGLCSAVTPVEKCAAMQAALLRHAGPVAVLEPELVLVFGAARTSAGYPPWALRLSEFHFLGKLQGVTLARLEASIARYCRTEKRFGR